MVSFWQHNVPYAVWDSKRVINYKGMGLQMVLRSGRWGGRVRPLVHKRDNEREIGVRGKGRILFYMAGKQVRDHTHTHWERDW